MMIAPGALDAIRAHAREAAPRECCGVLIGKRDAICEAVPAKNLAPGATRYELDPEDHVAARRAARDKHLEVVGFYHSHPHSAAWPSGTDIAEATYPEAVYLILGMSGAGEEVKAFRIDGTSVQEMSLMVGSVP